MERCVSLLWFQPVDMLLVSEGSKAQMKKRKRNLVLDNGLCTSIPDFFIFINIYIYLFPFVIGKLIWENFAFVVHFCFFQKKDFFFLLLSVYKKHCTSFSFSLGDLCCLCRMLCFELSLNVHPFGHFLSLISIPCSFLSIWIRNCLVVPVFTGKTHVEVNSQFLP